MNKIIKFSIKTCQNIYLGKEAIIIPINFGINIYSFLNKGIRVDAIG
jgi:hypothetical protein